MPSVVWNGVILDGLSVSYKALIACSFTVTLELL